MLVAACGLCESSVSAGAADRLPRVGEVVTFDDGSVERPCEVSGIVWLNGSAALRLRQGEEELLASRDQVRPRGWLLGF
jgi:hypothetical protein